MSESRQNTRECWQMRCKKLHYDHLKVRKDPNAMCNHCGRKRAFGTSVLPEEKRRRTVSGQIPSQWQLKQFNKRVQMVDQEDEDEKHTVLNVEAKRIQSHTIWKVLLTETDSKL